MWGTPIAGWLSGCVAVWSWRPCQLAHGPALLSCPWSRVRIPVRGGFVSCPSAPAARCVCLATKRARPATKLPTRRCLPATEGITDCLGHWVFGCKHESILNTFRFTVYVPAVDGSLIHCTLRRRRGMNTRVTSREIRVHAYTSTTGTVKPEDKKPGQVIVSTAVVPYAVSIIHEVVSGTPA